MDRQHPIAYIGEEFEFMAARPGYFCIGYGIVLQVSKNHFTDEYVYKIRRDFDDGEVDEAWYTEKEVQMMKGPGIDAPGALTL